MTERSIAQDEIVMNCTHKWKVLERNEYERRDPLNGQTFDTVINVLVTCDKCGAIEKYRL